MTDIKTKIAEYDQKSITEKAPKLYALAKGIFDKFNIETTIELQTNNNNKQPILYILKKSRSSFYNLVKPYIIPEMEYKFKNWNP